MTHPAPSDTDSDIPSLTHSKASGTYVLLFVIALILLALLPSQASWVDANRGWYTQPILGPALGLVILTIGAFARIRPTLRRAFSRSETYKTDYLFDALDGARTALMSSVLFFMYIKLVPAIGFFLATLLFVSTLLWLSRLLDRTWFFASLVTIIALIVIFRVLLHVWLPDVWLYSLLPDALADFANQYL